MIQRHNRYLVRTPQMPQHCQADTLPPLRRLNFEHVDVQPIAQRIDPIIDVANALATDLDVVQVVGTGKYKTAPWGFLPRFFMVNRSSGLPLELGIERLMPEINTPSLFIVTALAEIVGCYLPYLWLGNCSL